MRSCWYARAATLMLLGWVGAVGCREQGSTPTPTPTLHAEQAPPSGAGSSLETTAELATLPSDGVVVERSRARLAELAARARGKVGISIVHVESGRHVSVGGQQRLPLQSVFKLPLAVAVLRAVQEGRLTLGQALTVTAEDRAPGVAMNEKKWAQLPRAVSVRQLLEYSLVDSDNTSSDKLLDGIGGPGALTSKMRSLGFEGIAVRAPTQAVGPSGELPNDATAEALTHLLASLSRGEVIGARQRAVLWDMLGRARTGERRIRAGVPPGTPVLDKTGTGRNGSVTNDVGLVTLPGDAGHLAIAVLIAASPLPTRAQEDLIAEIARTAFDSGVSSP